MKELDTLVEELEKENLNENEQVNETKELPYSEEEFDVIRSSN